MDTIAKSAPTISALKVFTYIVGVRICDIGGWLDTRFVKEIFRRVTHIFNLSAKLPVMATLTISDGAPGIFIISRDLGYRAVVTNDSIGTFSSPLALLESAVYQIFKVRSTDVKRLMRSHAEVVITSDVPPACGVGTSAAVAVALIGVIAKAIDYHCTPRTLAKLAHQSELGQSGTQDQVSAAYGGACLVFSDYPDFRVKRIPLSPKFLAEWPQRTSIIYLSSHESSKAHEIIIQVISKAQAGDTHLKNIFEAMDECALAMPAAVMACNWQRIAELIDTNGRMQAAMHPDMMSTRALEAEKIARENGAKAFKPHGAGFGGSAMIYAEPDRKPAIDAALAAAGFKILPTYINTKVGA